MSYMKKSNMKKALAATLAVVIIGGCLMGCKNESDKKPSQSQTPIPEKSDKIKTYTNPVLTKSDKGGQKNGYGDPFVMRYNGVYYLYPSATNDNNINCWSSTDLINWKNEGTVASSPVINHAYAPEVYYYNGEFYMYCSPGGNGHYVLKSDSPTGPFKTCTGNFGLSIDGSVFVDDDGKWYFYAASGEGIKVYNMTSPSKVSASGTNTGASMGGWTEGPMVVKYDGMYYMTYCGNHVYSRGYRVNCATATKAPTSFTPESDNPLLVSTDGMIIATGHSSTVIGPNLDQYYIVYHSLVESDKSRNMCIDPLYFTKEGSYVLGASYSKQQRPLMPDAYSNFTDSKESKENSGYFKLTKAEQKKDHLLLSEGGMAMTKESFGDVFTAEVNFLEIVKGGKGGVYFAYKDKDNYGSAVFDPDKQILEITFCINGQKTVKSEKLVTSFNNKVDFSALQQLTIKRSGSSFAFFVNSLELCRYEADLPEGTVGAFAQGKSVKLGFVGVTGDSWQSSASKLYKALETVIPAFAFENNQLGTNVLSEGVTMASGADYTYAVNTKKSGKYDIALRYSASSESELTISYEGKEITKVTLPSTNGLAATYIVRGAELSGGMSKLTFKFSNPIKLKEFECSASAEVGELDLKSHSYKDGIWSVSGNTVTANNDGTSYGKILYGDKGMGDVTVSADLFVTAGGKNIGLLVRATNPATGNDGILSMGSDYLKGYFVGITSSGITLGKMNYAWKNLESYKCDIQTNRAYNVKVSAVGATLTVWLDGEKIIEYTDSDAFMSGMAGVRVHKCAGRAENFTLAKAE